MRTNEERAERAAAALAKYTALDNGAAYATDPVQTRLGNLLCDLRHFARALDIDWKEVSYTATHDFEAELYEEEANLAEEG